MTKRALAGRIKGLFCMRCRQKGLVLTILASALLSLPVKAADFTGCNGCHKTIMGELFRTFLHVPFQQQRCGECHEAQEATAPLALNEVDRRKIHWLGESFMADTSHGFLLSGEKTAGSLVVEAQGSSGTLSRQEISVPPLADLARVEDTGKPPSISEVRVLNVQRYVFLSATIGWRTDTLTDALVRYGNKDLSQASQPGNRLGRRHQVVLYNLKPDQTYRFSVVSKDLFGRLQASEPLTFSTSAQFSAPQQVAGNPSKGGSGDGMLSRFQRLGTDYLLELTLEQPSSVLVGSRAVPQQKLSGGSPGATGGSDVFHTGLSSKQATSIEACRSCHRGQATATHPVNVLPKPGMIIPPEYPTLPDGRISCRSCHESHSSENEYLTIKAGRRELCIGCHRDMI